MTAFDYHYVTGHGKNRRVHNLSALVIQSPHALKPLYIRPENIFANLFSFKQAEYFEIEEVGAAHVPKVDLSREKDSGSE